jgi:cell division protein FtsN
MLNPQGYGYGGMNPYGQRPVQQRPPQRPSQQQQQQQRPATAPAAGKQGSQGTSSQVKQGQPLKQQQQAAAPVATRPGVPGAVKPAPGTANSMLANIPKEDKTVLGLHLEKASLIEMLQAERSRSGKQVGAPRASAMSGIFP